MNKGSGITKRESEVLWLMSSGQDQSEVARAMHVSKRTVGFHLCNAYAKLKVNNLLSALLVVGMVERKCK